MYAYAIIEDRALGHPRVVEVLRQMFTHRLGREPNHYDWRFHPVGEILWEGEPPLGRSHMSIYAYSGAK